MVTLFFTTARPVKLEEVEKKEAFMAEILYSVNGIDYGLMSMFEVYLHGLFTHSNSKQMRTPVACRCAVLQLGRSFCSSQWYQLGKSSFKLLNGWFGMPLNSSWLKLSRDFILDCFLLIWLNYIGAYFKRQSKLFWCHPVKHNESFNHTVNIENQSPKIP